MKPVFRARSGGRAKTTLAPFRERRGAERSRPRSIRASRFSRPATSPRRRSSFKKAIEPEVDSTAPLTYLAASFAAAGKDREAASAWQSNT